MIGYYISENINRIIENIFQESAFGKKKKKPGLKFNCGLALIGVRTTGPWKGHIAGRRVFSPLHHPCSPFIPHLRQFWLNWMWKCEGTARGFSRMRQEFSVLAEGRHIFGRSHERRSREKKRFCFQEKNSCVFNPLFVRFTIKTWQKPETALEKSLPPRVMWRRLRNEKPCKASIS